MNTKLNIYKIGSNIDNISNFIFKFLTIISIFELILFPSWDTVYAILAIFIGLIFFKKCFLSPSKLLYYPASTLAISFYILFFLILPMPATLIELKPVTYNLHSTLDTFTNVLLLELVIIIIHLLYRMISNKKNIIRPILVKYNFFTKVTSSELWILIIISSILWIYIILGSGLYTEDSSNTISTLPTPLYILNLLVAGYSSIPFVFFMRNYNIIKEPYHIHKAAIIIFSISLFIIGIATNMRTAAISVLANAFFLFIVYNIYFPINLKQYLTPKSITITILIIYFFTGPFMSISQAMLQNRGNREGKNGLEMLEMTMNTLQENKDNNTLPNYKQEEGITWDESYLSNDILNRFCSLKILDETLFHAKRIGYANPIMQEQLKLKILDCLPGFIKEQFKIDQIPEDIRQSSLTDILYSLSIHSTSNLGGIKIGTLQGLGLAIFGYWYPLVLIPIFIIIFYFLDATIIFNVKTKSMYFSLWFLANIITICYYFSDKHYYLNEFRYIIRGYAESIIFYLITINIIKKIPFIKH